MINNINKLKKENNFSINFVQKVMSCFYLILISLIPLIIFLTLQNLNYFSLLNYIF